MPRTPKMNKSDRSGIKQGEARASLALFMEIVVLPCFIDTLQLWPGSARIPEPCGNAVNRKQHFPKQLSVILPLLS